MVFDLDKIGTGPNWNRNVILILVSVLGLSIASFGAVAMAISPE